jgi:hypothetical protein
MRTVMTGFIFNVLFAAAGLADGMPSVLTSTQLFDFCASQTIAEAERKGGQLGWRRMAAAELVEWRASFASYNGGSVEVLGWRRGGKNGDDSLSFWVARGLNEHRACSYSAANPTRLLDDLSERFGTPSTSINTNSEPQLFGDLARWKFPFLKPDRAPSSTLLITIDGWQAANCGRPGRPGHAQQRCMGSVCEELTDDEKDFAAAATRII